MQEQTERALGAEREREYWTASWVYSTSMSLIETQLQEQQAQNRKVVS